MSTTQILVWAVAVLGIAAGVGVNWYRLKDALSMYWNRKR